MTRTDALIHLAGQLSITARPEERAGHNFIAQDAHLLLFALEREAIGRGAPLQYSANLEDKLQPLLDIASTMIAPVEHGDLGHDGEPADAPPETTEPPTCSARGGD